MEIDFCSACFLIIAAYRNGMYTAEMIKIHKESMALIKRSKNILKKL